jgi:hypothetical protein
MKIPTIKFATTYDDKLVLIPSGPGLVNILKNRPELFEEETITIAGVPNIIALTKHFPAGIRQCDIKVNVKRNTFYCRVYTNSEHNWEITFANELTLADNKGDTNANRADKTSGTSKASGTTKEHPSIPAQGSSSAGTGTGARPGS